MAATTGLGPRDNERPAGPTGDADARAHRGLRAGNRPLGAVLAALVVGVLLGAAATAFVNGADAGDDFAGVVDDSRYQAVILSNDKVYFGQLEGASDDFFRLDAAFFLRETRENADAEPVRALLPVNREIHAPDNTMLIRKAEVVLIENLAEDSPILAEIERQLGDE